MQLETSTTIPTTEVAKVEKIMRDAASQSNGENFFGASEKIEVVNNPNAPSIDELSKKLNGGMKPMGDPNICNIAYAAARAACQGNPLCEVVAAAAHQACLNS